MFIFLSFEIVFDFYIFLEFIFYFKQVHLFFFFFFFLSQNKKKKNSFSNLNILLCFLHFRCSAFVRCYIMNIGSKHWSQREKGSKVERERENPLTFIYIGQNVAFLLDSLFRSPFIFLSRLREDAYAVFLGRTYSNIVLSFHSYSPFFLLLSLPFVGSLF